MKWFWKLFQRKKQLLAAPRILASPNRLEFHKNRFRLALEQTQNPAKAADLRKWAAFYEDLSSSLSEKGFL